MHLGCPLCSTACKVGKHQPRFCTSPPPSMQYYLADQVADNCKKGLLLTVTIK